MGFFKSVRPSHFGLMFIHMWIYCITHRASATEDVPIMTCLYISQALVLAAIVLYTFRRPIDHDLGRFLDLASAACMAAAAILICFPLPSSHGGALAFGACIGAVGVSWAYVRWAQLYSQMDIRYAAPLIFLTMAAGSAGKTLIDLMPDVAAAVSLMLLPVGVFGTWVFARRSLPAAPAAALLYNPRTVLSLWRLTVGVAVYSLAVGIIQSVMLEQIPVGDATSVLVHHGTEMLLGIGLFLWVAPMKRGLSFSGSWRLVVLLMTTALVFLPYIDESLLSYLLSLIRTAQTFLIVLLFLTLADIARHSTYHTATVFAAGWAAYALPFGIGTALGHFLQLAAAAETIIASAIVWAIVLAAIYLLDENAVGRSLVFPELNAPDDGDGDSDVARISAAQTQLDIGREQREAEDVVTRRCQTLAQQAGLTGREEEILELLARGRSKAYIADAFIISENTVRTHVKHLYAKLEVHTRQELLDRVESAEVSPEEP